MTEPLTPPEADLRDFPFMPLHIQDLTGGSFASQIDPEACWYAVLLWCAAWHQTPAGSLPDDEPTLTRLCGLGRDIATFRRIRDGALHKFIKCDDGKLYHPFLAEQVIKSWNAKLQQRWRTELARIKKANDRGGLQLPKPTYEEFVATMSLGTKRNVPRDKADCPQGQGIQERGKLKVSKIISEAKASSSSALPDDRPTADWDLIEDQQQSSVQPEPDKPPVVEEPEKPAKPKRQPRPDVDPDQIQTAFDEWNTLAKRLNLPLARDLTPERRKRLKARIAKSGLDGWREALAAVEASDFCKGLKTDFRAGLDFLLQPSSFQKLIEGGYGRDAAPSGAKPGERRYRFPNEEIRAAVAMELGEDWVSRRLDYCEFQEVPTRAILANNDFMRDEILRERDVFKRLRIDSVKLSPRAVA